MVSLEKNDRVMLARQLPLKSVALILGRRPWHASKRFNEQTRQTSRPLWWGSSASSISPYLIV
ncbi:Glucose-1-phosphate adenylyltransferase [Salmonella enterica subsp. enterica]|nr:Glucose-1-phosphate adenylyltransferase [Salmonella enterica subsp. enterica]